MEAPPLERKLVAILAADVVGYSRLMGLDEEGTLATLSAHRTIADALIAAHGGRICGTAGDSLLAEFASVFASVDCAVEIQRDIAAANHELSEDRRMWFRIGINVGDVMVKDDDIFGDGVNIAARLEGLADAGGICISRGVHDHVRRKLGYTYEDLGEQRVKNISQPIRVYRLIPGEPKPETLELERQDMVTSPDQPSRPDADEPAPSVELVFWESIKDSSRVSDYEAYLEQYPEGSFVSLAHIRLGEAISGKEEPDQQDREVELSFWESIRESGNPETLKAYLEKYPDGEFRSLAEIRLSELAQANRPSQKS
ncbi:MAG TPA: adenylate/guanylate cyclase domain-containing protein [Stellaceae bacterium]|jgi:class 3 adenylate cyclase|nr:adenylate/guanylate cyclase domain-containing protein [Stellaceae bacterium]